MLNRFPSKKFIKFMKESLGIDVDPDKTIEEQSDIYSIGLTGLWMVWNRKMR